MFWLITWVDHYMHIKQFTLCFLNLIGNTQLSGTKNKVCSHFNHSSVFKSESSNCLYYCSEVLSAAVERQSKAGLIV